MDIVKGQSVNIDGKEYAAAFDGKRVIWESEPGAAERVRQERTLRRIK